MPVFELARFTVDPSNADQLLRKRGPMVEAMRTRFPGLIHADLARIDERTWIDVWKWQSRDEAEAAAAQAPSVPEAADMFALIQDVVSMEHAEIADSA